MKLQISNDLKNCGLPSPILYKPDHMIGNMPTYKADSLKTNMKTQPVDKDS